MPSGTYRKATSTKLIYSAAQWEQDELTDIPAPLTQMTLFPYQAGLRFVQALYRTSNNWSLVDAAFAIPRCPPSKSFMWRNTSLSPTFPFRSPCRRSKTRWAEAGTKSIVECLANSFSGCICHRIPR